MSRSVLPALLARVATRWPGLTVSVVDGHDDELVDWLHDRVVDLAVVTGAPAGLTLQPLLTDQLQVVLPQSHPLSAQRSIHARELVDLLFILTNAGCERMILSSLAGRGLTPDVVRQVNESSAILTMVSDGLGVSVMPELAARDLPPGVVLRPLSPPALRSVSLAVLARDTQPAATVQAVLHEASKIKTSRLD